MKWVHECTKKKLIACLVGTLLLITVLITGCTKEEKPPNQMHSTKVTQEETFDYDSSWMVYWDNPVEKVLQNEEDKNLILFACYFDEKGQLFIPEQLTEMRESVKDYTKGKKYLSFVNDIQYEDGTSKQKDTQLLETIFKDEASMTAYIDCILNTVSEWECDGVEIDFEKIEAGGLWDKYLRFLELLVQKANEQEKEIRVVLSSSAPIEEIRLPEGPQYVVMCYNLFGYHSGAGPKADKAFLSQLAKKFSALHSVEFALANGGFEWNEEGKVTRSLKEQQINALIKAYDIKPKRDKESQALFFDYEEGKDRYTIWYADSHTLKAWKETLQNSYSDIDPVKISLWRIEGK